jgi:hypothetical protein
MLKLVRFFILSLFVTGNVAFADPSNLPIGIGDHGEAFKDISVNKKDLTSEERGILKDHHKEIKKHHNEKIGSGGYKVIHMAKRPSGTLESAIKFQHPEGGEFVYQSVVKKDRDDKDGHKLLRGTKVYGAYKETLAVHQAKSKKDFSKNLKKDFDNVQKIISSAKMIGDNYKGLSDKDFRKQFKSIAKNLEADSMKLHKYGTSIQQDKYLKYLHDSISHIRQSLDVEEFDRDSTNRYYDNFRGSFEEFYTKRLAGWHEEHAPAKQNLKESTRSIAARHPGKFQPIDNASWGDKFSSWWSSDSDEDEDEE